MLNHLRQHYVIRKLLTTTTHPLTHCSNFPITKGSNNTTNLHHHRNCRHVMAVVTKLMGRNALLSVVHGAKTVVFAANRTTSHRSVVKTPRTLCIRYNLTQRIHPLDDYYPTSLRKPMLEMLNRFSQFSPSNMIHPLTPIHQ